MNNDVTTNTGSTGQGEPQDLRLLSTREVAIRLAEETSLFLKGRTSDGRYGVELFRRAIGGDQEAWEYVFAQYHPLVLTWVNQHQSAVPLLALDGAAPLVNAAFAKFAVALTPVKMDNFDSLPAILKYLKMCVHSVIADEVRSRQARQYEDTLEAIEHEPATDDPADAVVSIISAQGLWQAIQEELNAEDERVLIYLTYVLGMKPAEICSKHQRLFPTVDDIYRIKRNVLERLRRNRRLLVYCRGHVA